MPDRWPWPNDNATTRARRIAGSYRQALRLNNRHLCDQIDGVMVDYGETWVVETEVTTEPDGLDELTTAQAAELVHVPEHTIRRWACTADPRDPERMLLPRFKRRGREMTYLAKDVIDAARFVRGPVGLPPAS